MTSHSITRRAPETRLAPFCFRFLLPQLHAVASRVSQQCESSWITSTKMAGLLSRILSYGPKKKVLTAEQTARSVVVSNISPQTTAATIVIYFQWQRNGGGEIDHAHIPKKGTAVITFESREGL